MAEDLVPAAEVTPAKSKRGTAPEFIAKQWPKGVSGNPGGRAKKKPVTDAYGAALNETITKKIADEHKLPKRFIGKTVLYALAWGQAMAAVRGETPPAKEIADRVEGKVTDRLAFGDPDDGFDPTMRLMGILAGALARAQK